MKISEEVLALLGPIPESSLPRNQWEKRFVEEGTDRLVRQYGEEWVKRHKEMLKAQLKFIWSL